MDVHRDFCEIAIVEDGGRVRSAGRIQSTLDGLRVFAQSLSPEDVVALEATSGAGLIAEISEPHVVAVVVANTRKLPQISKAKAKTDRLDARTLARLAASGFLETVWAPDESTRALRRLCARREALVRARTRAKNEAHAVPARNLWPPAGDRLLWQEGPRVAGRTAAARRRATDARRVPAPGRFPRHRD